MPLTSTQLPSAGCDPPNGVVQLLSSSNSVKFVLQLPPLAGQVHSQMRLSVESSWNDALLG